MLLQTSPPLLLLMAVSDEASSRASLSALSLTSSQAQSSESPVEECRRGMLKLPLAQPSTPPTVRCTLSCSVRLTTAATFWSRVPSVCLMFTEAASPSELHSLPHSILHTNTFSFFAFFFPPSSRVNSVPVPPHVPITLSHCHLSRPVTGHHHSTSLS